MTRRAAILFLSLTALLLGLASPLAIRALRAQNAALQAGVPIVSSATLQARANAGVVSPFRSVDVYVDSGAAPLAAYQFEFNAVNAGDAKLVGIEGGEHAAFREPPRYDPRALALPSPRVIVAAFDTSKELPTGRTRVARLMLRVAPDGPAPTYEARLTVAAAPDAKRLDAAKIELVEGALP